MAHLTLADEALAADSSPEALAARIRAHLVDIQPTGDWSGLLAILDRPLRRGAKPCWQYPIHAAQAVGGHATEALPAASAVYCSFVAIAIADDILDDDPKGIHLRDGLGAACNMALAFQSLGATVLATSSLSAERKLMAIERYHRLNLDTGFGQYLDTLDVAGEEGYWQMVRHKTPPLFAGGLYLGALFGGAAAQQADQIYKLGETLGEIVQISDDLSDALERPAQPDWNRDSGNLAILYARLAEHPDREEFLRRKPLVADDEHLTRAQEILVRCGAVSYCVYRMIEAHRRARRQLEALDALDRAPLQDIFDHHAKPLKHMMARTGIEAPDDLFH